MDGTGKGKDMRARAELGAISCCDYLLRVGDESFTLIETTDLGLTIRDMRDKYHAMMSDHSVWREFVMDRVQRENCMKVYGSMLVLCRLRQWPRDCGFYLVFSDDVGQARVVRNLDPNDEWEAKIKTALEGRLRGGKLVNEVKVITADELHDLLQDASLP